ncbi:hypothetical protein RRG08_008721 [Elysia crispata]|uniref:Uncharacterized protein n=1 Tax=Elysia crispata TaxID=231223 RepID=A0AAE0XPV8_9GAST|nr:hypothetical protein RRG08_008721 [Elysia crispata]
MNETNKSDQTGLMVSMINDLGVRLETMSLAALWEGCLKVESQQLVIFHCEWSAFQYDTNWFTKYTIAHFFIHTHNVSGRPGHVTKDLCEGRPVRVLFSVRAPGFSTGMERSTYEEKALLLKIKELHPMPIPKTSELKIKYCLVHNATNFESLPRYFVFQAATYATGYVGDSLKKRRLLSQVSILEKWSHDDQTQNRDVMTSTCFNQNSGNITQLVPYMDRLFPSEWVTVYSKLCVSVIQRNKIAVCSNTYC